MNVTGWIGQEQGLHSLKLHIAKVGDYSIVHKGEVVHRPEAGVR